MRKTIAGLAAAALVPDGVASADTEGTETYDTNGPFGWLEGDSQSSRTLAQCGLKGWRQAWQG